MYLKFSDINSKVNFCGIYKIINLNNNKFYIGSTCNLYKRFRRHIWELKGNKHRNYYLQNSYNKYGEDSFIIELLTSAEKKELLKTEQYYLDTLKPHYNIQVTAGSNLGYRQSKKEIQKRTNSLVETYSVKYNIDLHKIKTLIDSGLSTKEISEKLGYKTKNRLYKYLIRKGIKNPNKHKKGKLNYKSKYIIHVFDKDFKIIEKTNMLVYLKNKYNITNSQLNSSLKHFKIRNDKYFFIKDIDLEKFFRKNGV